MTSLPAPYDQFYAATSGQNTVTPLPKDSRFSEASHFWSESERRAVLQAWASERPLLVRGEAGSGKSQLARALAAVLNVPLEPEVIHPRFEATDLKYREDHLRRLAQAQVMGVLQPPADAEELKGWLAVKMHPRLFITKGAIWRAFTTPPPQVQKEPRHAHWPRAVLLIDEIDKADADVPHALLDVLGNRSFQVPATGETVQCEAHWPLIIITTNEDRELPAPFVRRCAVLNLKPPSHELEDGKPFVQWLVERARAHKGLAPLGGDPQNLLQRAAEQTLADRRAAADQGLPTVGLAEYLDLLYSLLRVSGGDAARAGEWLDQLSAFALVKQREQDQQRAPVTSPAAAR